MVRIKIPLQEFYICAISQSFNTPSHWPVLFTKLLQSICVIPLYYKTTAMWLLRNIHNVWIKNDRRIVFSFAIEFNAINRMEKYIMIINTIYLTVKRYNHKFRREHGESDVFNGFKNALNWFNSTKNISICQSNFLDLYKGVLMTWK